MYGDLDEQRACRHLLRKSIQEAAGMLEDNFLRYQEDYMWMGPVAFCYYVDAMIGYITTTGDAEELRIYHSICEFRLNDLGVRQMRPCAARVATSLDLIACRLDTLDTELALRMRRTSHSYRELADGERPSSPPRD
ncbi:MAG: hypothetical protein KF724_13585 [Phycisphaeraceae bacterium]|nr:hypothetical protein [Phycisphaeraceae bacterium]